MSENVQAWCKNPKKHPKHLVITQTVSVPFSDYFYLLQNTKNKLIDTIHFIITQFTLQKFSGSMVYGNFQWNFMTASCAITP